MASVKFDLSSITRDADVVAAVFPASAVFGMLRRTLDLPPYWAALVTTEHGEKRVCAAGSQVDGQGVEEIMLVRTNPINVPYQFERVNSQDDYLCSVALSVCMQLSEDSSELAALRANVLGGKSHLETSGLQTEFGSAVREGVERFVRSRGAAHLAEGAEISELREALQTVLEAPLFQSGFRFIDLRGVVIESKSYRQLQRRQVQLEREQQQQGLRTRLRRAVEEAQNERLAHLQTLLTRLKSLADDSPQADLGELLKTFEASQRGELYEALWSESEPQRTTQWLVVVCGSSLLYFDPVDFGQPVHCVELETPIGSLRSICHCLSADNTSVLLIGAARGGLIVHAESGDILGTYPTEAPAGRQIHGGFNSVALAGDYVFGAHSELGVWRWEVDNPEVATAMLVETTAGAGTVRQIQFVDGRVFVAIDNRVESILPGDDSAAMTHGASPAAITALLCCAGRIYAGSTTGEVLCWRSDAPEGAETLHRGNGRAVESLGKVSTNGVQRLFFTDTSSAVHAQVIGDTFGCRYQAGGQTIRRAEFAADWIVGTNETRDRLFCWPTGEPSASPTVLAVGQITGRSIQDVCLVPRITS